MKLENKTVEELRNILVGENFHLPEHWNKYALIVAIRATQGEQAKDYLAQGCIVDYIVAQQPTKRYYKVINSVLHYKDSESRDWVEAVSTLEEHDGCNFIVVKY